MNIGAQLYSIRAFTQTESDFAASMEKVAKIGYRGIQLSGAGDFDAKTIRKICDDNGLQIVATHTNPQKVLTQTEKVIEEHQTMGAEYVGVGSMPGEYRGESPDPSRGLEGVRRFIADFQRTARVIKEAGLRFTYHNHAFEFEKYEGKLILEHLTDGFAVEELACVLDVYWVQAGGGDPALWLGKLHGRLDIIHFKDMTIVGGEQRFAEVLEGNLNWPAIFDACAKAKVKWAFVEQDDCYGRDPFDCLRTSYDNLRKLGY